MNNTFCLIILLMFTTTAQAQNPEDAALIQAIIEQYASLDYYYDEGKVVIDKINKTNPMYNLRDEGTFKTLYQKNGKFLFQGNIKGRFSNKEININRIDSDSLKVEKLSSTRSHVITDISFLSSKYAYSPYFLLFDAFKEKKKHILKRDTEFKRLDDEVYEGELCYKIQYSQKVALTDSIQNILQQVVDSAKTSILGYDPPEFELPDQSGTVEIYWFRKKDYLLVRNEKRETLGEAAIRTVFSYNPKVDIILKEEDF